jgi:DNA-binding GntR family transcriptional regulator
VGRPTDDVYRALKADIFRGRLAPGEHLVEATLENRFKVSRTPIRNALRRLENEGLVAIASHRGAFVSSWTDADSAEVMAIRILLEPRAAALAAQRRSERDVERLLAICDDMEKCERERPEDFRSALAQQNHHLHLLVLEAARSPRLFTITKNLAQAPLVIGAYEYYEESQIRRSLADHRELVASIRLQDADSAHAIMAAHLQLAYRSMSNRAKI